MFVRVGTSDGGYLWRTSRVRTFRVVYDGRKGSCHIRNGHRKALVELNHEHNGVEQLPSKSIRDHARTVDDLTLWVPLLAFLVSCVIGVPKHGELNYLLSTVVRRMVWWLLEKTWENEKEGSNCNIDQPLKPSDINIAPLTPWSKI